MGYHRKQGQGSLITEKESGFSFRSHVKPFCCHRGDILKGYSIKKADNLLVTDYFTNTVPLGLWRVIYNGFDSSGNIHLKIIREKDDLNNDEKAWIRKEIERVGTLEKGKNILEERLAMFEGFKNYFDKEGENIIIDPKKIIVISNINDFPPIKIAVNDKHSVIHVTVTKLD